MAHEPRTHQLFAGSVSSAGVTTIATVPPGERWLLKYLTINSDATSPGVLVIFATVAGGASVFLTELAPVTGRAYVERECYGVLEEGDDLKVAIGSVTGGPANVHVGGLIFEL